MVGVSVETVNRTLKNFLDSNKFIEIKKFFKPLIYDIWNLQKKSEEDSRRTAEEFQEYL